MLNSYRGNRPLTREEIESAAPSVYATCPIDLASDKYRFIPTSDIVDRFREQGLMPVAVAQTRTVRDGRRGFANHEVRFRRAEDIGVPAKVGDSFPEIVLRNSHDLSSAYKVTAGLYRLICSNGMTTGRDAWTFRTKHIGDKVVDDVIEGTFRIVEDFPRLLEAVESWQAIELEEDMQRTFIEAAIPLRFTDPTLIDPNALNHARRAEDVGNSLWSTFNRLQENLTRKGTRVGTRQTRSITSLSEDARINSSLWSLTERMAELVG